jgi:hypothetical protein
VANRCVVRAYEDLAGRVLPLMLIVKAMKKAMKKLGGARRSRRDCVVAGLDCRLSATEEDGGRDLSWVFACQDRVIREMWIGEPSKFSARRRTSLGSAACIT